MCLNRKFLIIILIVSGLIILGIFRVNVLTSPSNTEPSNLKYVANVFLDDATNEWFVYAEEPSLEQIKTSLVEEKDKNINGHIISNVSIDDDLLCINGNDVNYRICKVPVNIIKEW